MGPRYPLGGHSFQHSSYSCPTLSLILHLSKEYYWEKVRERLIEIMVRNQYSEKPTKVLLLGESVHDETFARVLREALGSVLEAVPEILEDDAEFVAAKGAAEFCEASS